MANEEKTPEERENIEKAREGAILFLEQTMDNLEVDERRLRKTILYEAPAFQEIENTKSFLKNLIEQMREVPEPIKFLNTIMPILLKMKSKF